MTGTDQQPSSSATEADDLRKAREQIALLSRAVQECELSLSEAALQHRCISEASPDAVLTADHHGRILTCNRATMAMFAMPRHAIAGRCLADLFAPQCQEACLESMRRVLHRNPERPIESLVIEGQRGDSSTFPSEVMLSSWHSPRGRFLGAHVRDITEQMRIDGVRETVQRMMRHELKSPLVGVAGFAGLLLKSPCLGAKEQEWAAMILDLSQKMLEVINRSADLFKMAMGAYKLSPVPVDLGQLLRKLHAELTPLAERMQVRLVYVQGNRELGEKLPDAFRHELHGEASLLTLMLENLVKNAIEASPPGERVRIAIDTSPQEHLVAITNRGAIPEVIRDRFFEPYVTHGKPDGTGLGTYIARLIAMTHQGDIEFSTSEDHGTCVTVHLPRQLPGCLCR